MEKIPSWDRVCQKDCFGNDGSPIIRFIWPVDKLGINIENNKMLLSEKSIIKMGDNTKGTINGIRYSTTKQFVSREKIYGNMKVQFNKYGGWFEVEKINH